MGITRRFDEEGAWIVCVEQKYGAVHGQIGIDAAVKLSDVGKQEPVRLIREV